MLAQRPDQLAQVREVAGGEATGSRPQMPLADAASRRVRTGTAVESVVAAAPGLPTQDSRQSLNRFGLAIAQDPQQSGDSRVWRPARQTNAAKDGIEMRSGSSPATWVRPHIKV